MNETKKSASVGSLKYIFILIGIVVALLSYVLVYNKYTPINEDLTSEIKDLKDRRDELENKKKNKENVEANTKENNEKFDEILAKFDGGLSYQAEIMDIFYHRKDEKVKIDALSYAAPTDISTFSNGYVGKSMTYDYSVVSTYDQMKDILEYFRLYTEKRKVPNTISFQYDPNTHNITTTFNVKEYAIAGEGKEVLPTREPSCSTGTNNIFYDQSFR